MNIPASAPSIFQPSNILCSSTPMRQSVRHFTNRNTSADLHLDPSETPIRGPGVKRKTSSAVSRHESKIHSASRKGAVNKSKPTQHFSERSSLSAGNKNDTHVSSNSESDQTESDSCNVTGPQKSVSVPFQMLNIDNKPVNKKKGKSEKSVNKSAFLDGQREACNTSQNIPVIKSSDTDNDFATTDFNNEEELNDLNRTGGRSNVAASVPVFPSNKSMQSEIQYKKNRNKEQTTGCAQSRHSSLSASVPVLVKKNYTENQVDSENINQSHRELSQNEQGQNSQPSTRIPLSTVSSECINEHNPPSKGKVTSTITGLDIKMTGEDRPRLRIPSTLTDSFNEELLFDSSAVDQRVWTPRTPGENSGIQPRIPQDPSSEPEIPAVLPAKSTELTTFSQSPRWHLNKNQSNHPLLAQQAPGFKPEPICTIPKEEVRSRNQVATLLRSVHNIGFTNNDPQQRQLIPKNAEKKSLISPKQDLNPSIKKPGLNNDILKKSVLTANVEQREEKKEEAEPISANWFMTPADHETHVAESVSQRRTDECTSKKSPLHKSDNDNFKSKTDEQDLDDEDLPFHSHLAKNRFVHSDSSILSAASDSESKTSHSVKDVINKQNKCASGYTNSNFSKPGYFSDSGVRNMPDGFVAKHNLVHSPLTLRHNSNTSPVIKDYVSLSPTTGVSANSSLHFDGDVNSTSNKTSGNAILKTEKLEVGSTFSPIHPQPVTHGKVSKSTAVCKDILHPTPLSTVSASANVQQTLHVSNKASEVIDLK